MELIDRDAVLHDVSTECSNAHEAKYYEAQVALTRAKRIIRDAPAVNRWIPCSERLPEAGIPVLIYACKHRVTAYYDNCKNLFRLTEDDNLYYIAEYVTHWMPMPEPPKEDET